MSSVTANLLFYYVVVHVHVLLCIQTCTCICNIQRCCDINFVIDTAWKGVLYGLYSHEPEGGAPRASGCISHIAQTCHAICVVHVYPYFLA